MDLTQYQEKYYDEISQKAMQVLRKTHEAEFWDIYEAISLKEFDEYQQLKAEHQNDLYNDDLTGSDQEAFCN